jgi:hypothetical protein
MLDARQMLASLTVSSSPSRFSLSRFDAITQFMGASRIAEFSLFLLEDYRYHSRAPNRQMFIEISSG